MNELTNILKKEVEIDDITLRYSKFDLSIPGDFLLKKFTIYITIDDKEQAICDVYTSTSYEIVPYIDNTLSDNESNKSTDKSSPDKSNSDLLLRYGSYWVILRFLFIEIWTLLLIKGLKVGENTTFFDNKIASILEWLQKLRSMNISFDDKFPFTYEGSFTTENVLKKQFQIMDRPYYPYLNHKK
jgi:hypothetical protein